MANCVSPGGKFLPSTCTITNCIVEKHAKYVIDICSPNKCRWTIVKRYREFYALHKKLLKNYSLLNGILLPGKIYGFASSQLLLKRRSDLERYLQALLDLFPLPPKPLSEFICWHLYEIHGITAVLSKYLYQHGAEILKNDHLFELSVDQLSAINERLISPTVTNFTHEPGGDFGHVMSFVNELKRLKISGSNACVGNSNIVPNSLQFDISLFKKLIYLELSCVNLKMMKGFENLKNCLLSLRVHFSLDQVKSITLGDIYSIGNGKWVFGNDAVSTTKWLHLTDVNLSNNFLHCLDSSMMLFANVVRLNLSHNNLIDLQHLSSLTNLREICLSYNKLCVLEQSILDVDSGIFENSMPEESDADIVVESEENPLCSLDLSISKKSNPFMGLCVYLPGIKLLQIDNNMLNSTKLVDRLQMLLALDLSYNCINSWNSLKPLCGLISLEKLFLHHNPIENHSDYRTEVFFHLGDRFVKVLLDGQEISEHEEEMVNLKRALREGSSSSRELLVNAD